MKATALILFLSFLSDLSAQEGKNIYQTYCAACHGAHGEGRKGAAPPLAQSNWVNGDPNIITRVLLHGVQGRISVHGESYELVMPAQTLLNDKQVAEVATFVRSQWGNKAPAIDENLVKKIRKETETQTGVINSMHLVKPYDLKDYTVKVKNLLSSSFPFTTDFDSLEDATPKGIEEESSGLLDPLQAGAVGESFTAKWSGLIDIKKAGKYDFSFGTDHAARISIDGKIVLEREKGTQPSVGSIKLEKGSVELDVYYAHEADTPSFFRLFMSGPGINMYRMHNMMKKKKQPPITINPTKDRALVHRNFLVKGGERMLAVGLPQKVNFYFSTEYMRLSKLWSGEFLNVGMTWDGRARNKMAEPLGKAFSVVEKGNVFKVSAKTLKSWEDKGSKPAEQQFNGYKYDKDGNPVFAYTIGGYSFIDHYSAESEAGSLMRKIIIKPSKDSVSSLYWKLLGNAEAINKVTFKADNGVQIKVLSASSTPVLLDNDVVMKITQPTTITLEYDWK